MILETLNPTMTFPIDDDSRWRAVIDRDETADGLFVVAVRSTGIYCRPSCPARNPLRKNVAFYSSPDGARAAGYRPCKRCRPDDTTSLDPQVELVHEVCHAIEEQIDQPDRLTLEALGEQFHHSPYHLQRTFKRVTGITPRQYAEAVRVGRFKTNLRDGDSVTGALYDAGYGSSSRLYARADDNLGMTPVVYRKGGEGMDIHYTVAESSLGCLMVASTGRGICAVSLVDGCKQAEAALRDEYPCAGIAYDDTGLSEPVEAILAYLDGWRPHLDLSLDIQATAFQQRVWQELRQIPLGETRSYSEVAAAIGQPKATRAVARACAANPVPLVIPCHRVVRKNGDLGGYALGVERKRALLESEKQMAEAEASRDE
jgi:AraC family transcriptional regulator of adaptative response/methylated-DNA-[protein]-cysteine methyltransferase